MKKSKKANKLVIFFTIAILEMAAVGGFIGYKSYLIGKNVKILHKKTAVLAEKTALAQVANDLEIQKTEKETAIEKNKKLFFNDISLMDFLKNLYGTASVYNLSINSISFSNLSDAASTNPPIKLLPVNLSISGTQYNDIINFLAFLEKKGYSLKPNTTSINTSSRIKDISLSGTKSRTAISLSFTVYVQTNSSGGWSYKGGK